MNEIKNYGHFLEIRSHINYEALNILEQITANEVKFIQFSNKKTITIPGAGFSVEPNKDDIVILNKYFAKHKDVYLRWIENWWLPLLPELEKFIFIKYSQDDIDLIKDNNVTALQFEKSPVNKYDLTNLLVFKDTLEELFLNGNYKNLEITINKLEKLKNISLLSIKIDFKKIDKNKIEYLFYYGSKTKEWDEIIKLDKLKHLNIGNNTTLEDINFLKNFNKLEILELGYCVNIKVFPDLKHLQNLKKVRIVTCNKLENINEINKLTNAEVRIIK